MVFSQVFGNDINDMIKIKRSKYLYKYADNSTFKILKVRLQKDSVTKGHRYKRVAFQKDSGAAFLCCRYKAAIRSRIGDLY